jgi:phosphohistidine phosphatase
MKRLILIRHAKAEPADGADVLDIERALTERGRRDAQRMGDWLRSVVAQIDQVLISPSLRTRQTAEILFGSWEQRPAVQLEPSLYLPTLAELWSVVWSLEPQWTHVALVGHNPSLSQLRDELLSRALEPMPTCAVAIIACAVDRWQHLAPSRCVLEREHSPKGW